MNLTILQALYYLSAIIIPITAFFKFFIISNPLELVIMHNLQKNVSKIIYFLKFFILLGFSYSYLLFSFFLDLKKSFFLMDLLVYFVILYYLHDIFYLTLCNVKFLQKYIKFFKENNIIKLVIISLLSICFSFFTYLLSLITDIIDLSVLQAISLFIFINLIFEYIDKKEIQEKNAIEYYFINCLPVYVLKIIYLYNNPNFNRQELTITYFIKFICSIYYNNKVTTIAFCVGILIFITSGIITSLLFNLNSYIYYKNKYWKIMCITSDNYAICSHAHFSIMIKTDIIKSNYYSICKNNCFYFYEINSMKDIEI